MHLTRLQMLIVILCLGIFFCLSIISMLPHTSTMDEYNHYNYGAQILEGNTDRVGPNDSKMPFSSLNVLPAKLAGLLPQTEIFLAARVFLSDILTGRYVTMLFSVLLAWYVFLWSWELYGYSAGLLSLVLYIFCPNILAHSQLITTDLYAACTITIASYYFWRFVNHPTHKSAIVSAMTLGVSQLAKYTSIYLYPIFLLILLVRFGYYRSLRRSHVNFINIYRRCKRNAAYFGIFMFINFAVINAGFIFQRSFLPLKSYAFKSDLFIRFSRVLQPLQNLPIPLPFSYIQGLDLVKYNEQHGTNSGNIYLLGKLIKIGDPRSFKGYFFVAFLYKVPLATQILIISAFLYYLSHRRMFKFINNEIFLLCPIIFFTLYFNFFFRAENGLRYYLVAFPFCYIFTGNLLKKPIKLNSVCMRAIPVLLIWLIGSNLSYFPHYLAYFNELVGDRKYAYKILADSNIDWGQNRGYLEQYQRVHPGIIVNPGTPVAGTIVVRINYLVGVSFEYDKYKWLRENFKPVDQIGYSYLVYKVSRADLAKIVKPQPPVIK